MNFNQKIDYIKSAIEDNRLVIFVGAGISNNSDLPMWGSLIKEFARRISFSKCRECTSKEECENFNCQFSSDDYVKIPQYFYNMYGEEEYLKLINNILGKEVKPNDLNDIILELQPKHIITTNYDKLIENTSNVNKILYKVIRKDEDLIKIQNNNYILKMHGDIDFLKTIVLKEDDYLSYSQNHILIETFIKSLLLDHTFLFVGYSLNDYNLKLIIKWRDVIAEKYKASVEKCKSFIIDPKVYEKYEIEYHEKNGLYVIDDDDIPNDKIDNYTQNTRLTKEIGKKIYTVLKIINDSDNIEKQYDIDWLYENLQIFKNRNKIALCELENVFRIQNDGSEVIFNALIIRNLHIYEKLINILGKEDVKSQYIQDVFLKTGINQIKLWPTNKQFIIDSSRESAKSSEIESLLIENKFNTLYSKALNLNCSIEKLYCVYICNQKDLKFMDILNTLNEEELEEGDIFNLLLLKYNQIIIKENIRKDVHKEVIEFKNIWKNIRESKQKIVKFLNNIFMMEWDAQQHMMELDELEAIYMKKIDKNYYIGGSLYNLLKLKRYAYEYYFYSKKNLIIIDYNPLTKVILEPYIKGMLCTYAPEKQRNTKSYFSCNSGQLKSYSMNMIDIDMLVKYVDNKNLKKYIEEYSIKNFELDKVNIEDLVQHFYNLCISIIELNNEYLIEYLKNYLIVFSKITLINSNLEKIIDGITILKTSKQIRNSYIYSEIADNLIEVLDRHNKVTISNLNNLLDNLLEDEIIVAINKESIFEFRNLIKVINKKIDKVYLNSKVNNLITNSKQKFNMIFHLYYILIEKDKEKYKSEIEYNVDLINPYILSEFISTGVIEYNSQIEKRYLNLMEQELNKKIIAEQKISINFLETYINLIIILHLWGAVPDLKGYYKYIEYSVYLQFILESGKFDYSKVHTYDPMWCTIFKNEKYRELLVKYGYKDIYEELTSAIEGKYAIEDQKNIYYKYFYN